MSFEKTNDALNELFKSISLTQEDIEKTDIFSLPPSNKVAVEVIKKVKRENKSPKYFVLTPYKTKEDKMAAVLMEIIKATSKQLVTDLKENEIISIDYSRPYKKSVGGPVITVFENGKKTRFGEINNKFPLAGLVEEILKFEE